jgi:uncharacterized protein YbaP (TraB family)
LIKDLNQPVNEAIESYIGYVSGDETLIPGIEREVSSGDGNEKYDQMYIDHMMVQRDKMMAERIMEIAENHQGKVFFVAIGSAHYFNEGNVLELLEDEGFEIERK